jgi:hypothetical protein
VRSRPTDGWAGRERVGDRVGGGITGFTPWTNIY